MKTIVSTFAEIEAHALCLGKLYGLSTTADTKRIACDYILNLAERIKNERQQSILHIVSNR